MHPVIRVMCWFGAAAMSLASLGSTHAQTTPASQPAAPASAPATPSTDPTVAELNGRISQLAESKELEDDVRKKAADTYKQAVARLTEADNWDRKAAAFKQQRNDVPGLLNEARRRAGAAPEVAASSPTATMPAVELDRLLVEVDRQFEEAAKAVVELEKTRPDRAARRIVIARDQAEIRKKQDEMSTELATLSAAGAAGEPARSRTALLQASRRSLTAQLDALQSELAYYEAAVDLIPLQFDLAEGRRAAVDRRRKELQNAVNQRREAEAAEQARQAREEQIKAEQVSMKAQPALKQAADRNKELADDRQNLAEELRSLAGRQDWTEAELSRIERESTRYRGYVQTAGLTHEMGLVLRRQRTRLGNVRQLRREIADREKKIAERSLNQLDWTDERDRLRDLESEVSRIVTGTEGAARDAQRKQSESLARSLLTTRRDLLDALIKDVENLTIQLVKLNGKLTSLADASEQFADFIDENVLWIRSSRPISPSSLAGAPQVISRRVSEMDVSSSFRALFEDARENPVLHSAMWVLVTGLTAIRFRMRRVLSELGERVGNVRTDAFRLTVESLLISLAMALVWPLWLYLPGWRLQEAAGVSAIGRQTGAALQIAAGFVLLTGFVRILCLKKGLGVAHFRWRVRNIDIARRTLFQMLAFGTPLVFLQSLVQWQTADFDEVWIPRIALILGMIALAYFAWRLVNPRGGLTEELTARRPNGWLDRLQSIWFPAVVGLPLVLALSTVLGYNYTAYELQLRLAQTVAVGVGVLLGYSLLERWFFVAHRRLAFQAALKRRAAEDAAASAAAAGECDNANAAAIVIDENEVDLSGIHQQARGLLRMLATVSLLVGVYLVWVDLLPALGRFNRTPLWYRTVAASMAPGGTTAAAPGGVAETIEPVTIGDLGLAVILGILTLIASRNLPGVLEIAILQRLPLEPSARYAVSTVARYLITIVGLLIAFETVGLGWQQVQWLAAALTVGLGFGLQEIFANFVSGLILLFERPIRLGDTVTIGGTTGVVTRIRTRATTITDADRKEMIIPNKEFITGKVMNWTLSDSTVRVVIPIGVAYGSDAARVRALLLQIARANRRLLETPPPQAFFVGFGASTLNFELRAFVGQIDDSQVAQHELNSAIDEQFRAAGIEIAFPQLDLHLRSVDPATGGSTIQEVIGETRGIRV